MTRGRALVWIVGCAALTAALYLAIRQTRDLTDFAVYRTAGARLLHAEPLYQPTDGHFVFKYLPAFAYAVVPFALVGPETAKAIWFALSAVWLAIFVAGSIRELPDRRRALGPLLALTLLIMAKSLVRELSLGQTNTLLGALLVASLGLAIRRAPRMAGALVGLATFIKPYSILFTPWLVLVGGWPALASWGAVVVAGLLLPVVSYGWTGNLHLLAGWIATVSDSTLPNLLLPENVSFLAAWAKWLGMGPAASVLATATGLVALALAGWVLAKRRNVNHPAYLEFAVLCLLIPLLSPQGWDYMLLLGTPAVICLIDRWASQSRVWRVALATAFVLVALPIRELFGLTVARAVLGAGTLTVAASVLVVALARLRWLRAA